MVGQMPPLRLLTAFFLVLLPEAAGARELGSVAEVRRLSREEVGLPAEASFKARVTFVAAWKNRSEAAIQDSTEGIYAYLPPGAAVGLRLGDEVEVSGQSNHGVWSPGFRVLEIRKTGSRSLPEPAKVGYADLKSGAKDCQFVEVEGIVRDVRYDATVAPPSTIVSVAMRDGRAEVFATMMPEEQLRHLIDARVAVSGVPFHFFNQRRQVFDFRLMVCDASQLRVLEAPPSSAFDLPVTPVAQLLQFQVDGHSGHRVRVQGIVSLHWPGEFFFLQDGKDGLLVRSRGRQALKPGDFVDVAAFASMGRYAAYLEDAEFRRIESGRKPPVADFPLEDLGTGDADARLVRTEGVLESISERNGNAFLMLRKGTLIVPAQLPVSMAELPPMQPGSLLRVTGVCQVDVGTKRSFAVFFKPESSSLLLRSVRDVVVVRSAPWWTERRLMVALSVLGGVLGIAVVWAWTLQSRNARLHGEIAGRQRAEAEVKRREEERTLLAADLHDSLEQTLTGVALQLQAAGAAKVPANPHLDLAARLLKHSRAEVHRAVRDLREPSAEPLDLAAGLRGLVRRSQAGSGVRFDLAMPENLPELPARLSHALLHLAQEGVTNALKHAGAAVIRIALSITDGKAVLEIADDGKGFDPARNPRGPAEGHFGLQGMKERATRGGGTLEILSSPESGTRVRVVMPVGG